MPTIRIEMGKIGIKIGVLRPSSIKDKGRTTAGQWLKEMKVQKPRIVDFVETIYNKFDHLDVKNAEVLPSWSSLYIAMHSNQSSDPDPDPDFCKLIN